MADAVRAELLKLRSGYWSVAMLALAVWLPWLSWKFTGDGGLAPGGPSIYLMASPVAASFLGSFQVTRDLHYRSMARAVLSNGRRAVFAGKLVAGAVGGAASGVVGGVGWTALGAWVLPGPGEALVPDTDTAVVVAGCVVASTIAGLLGVCIGWILPNYYLAGALSMIVPFALEAPLLVTAPQVARFLPNTALAAVVDGQAPFGLLPTLPSAMIALAWVVSAAALGWWLFARREIR